MNAENPSLSQDTSDREIVTTRVFPVTVERLWAAWSHAPTLAKWWGPKDFTNTIHNLDLRPGGKWDFIMHGPNGADYENHSVFLEVEEHRRIVFDHAPPVHFIMHVDFEDMGTESRLTWRMCFEPAEQMWKMREFLINANEQNFDRLGAVLARVH